MPGANFVRVTRAARDVMDPKLVAHHVVAIIHGWNKVDWWGRKQWGNKGGAQIGKKIVSDRVHFLYIYTFPFLYPVFYSFLISHIQILLYIIKFLIMLDYANLSFNLKISMSTVKSAKMGKEIWFEQKWNLIEMMKYGYGWKKH